MKNHLWKSSEEFTWRQKVNIVQRRCRLQQTTGQNGNKGETMTMTTSSLYLARTTLA